MVNTAQKRMFDKCITNSDDFLELPISSQALYFHLSMNADDDGFVNNWKSILKMTGTKEDDLKILIMKSYLIPFDSGVLVIKHWRINNYLRNDRHVDTKFVEEMSMLSQGKSGEYSLKNEFGIPMVYPDKNSIDKNSIDNIYIVEKLDDKKEEISKNTIEQVVDYLNMKTGSKYKSTTSKTKTLIKARLKDGFTEKDFLKVIDNKCYEWLGTDYEKYLRPETLFGTKFESYLNQKTIEEIKQERNREIDSW